MVEYLGVGGNYSFARGAQRISFGKDRAREYDVQECMAATFGPGPEQCEKTSTKAGESYSSSVLKRAQSPKEHFWHMTSYYRDKVAYETWTKSLENIADLYNIESLSESGSPARRRSSAASRALFREQYKGALHAPATVLWGQKDQACGQAMCLDGICDYLAKDSEVVLLPKSGHWTAVEHESRGAIAQIVAMYVAKGMVSDATAAVQEVYEGAKLYGARK